MFVRQRNGGVPAKFGACLLAEIGREFRPTLVVEGYERAVEGGIRPARLSAIRGSVSTFAEPVSRNRPGR